MDDANRRRERNDGQRSDARAWLPGRAGQACACTVAVLHDHLDIVSSMGAGCANRQPCRANARSAGRCQWRAGGGHRRAQCARYFAQPLQQFQCRPERVDPQQQRADLQDRAGRLRCRQQQPAAQRRCVVDPQRSHLGQQSPAGLYRNRRCESAVGDRQPQRHFLRWLRLSQYLARHPDHRHTEPGQRWCVERFQHHRWCAEHRPQRSGRVQRGSTGSAVASAQRRWLGLDQGAGRRRWCRTGELRRHAAGRSARCRRRRSCDRHRCGAIGRHVCRTHSPDRHRSRRRRGEPRHVSRAKWRPADRQRWAIEPEWNQRGTRWRECACHRGAGSAWRARLAARRGVPACGQHDACRRPGRRRCAGCASRWCGEPCWPQ